MRIEWDQVTWYSKLIALALFVGLPFLGFWLGILYARSIGPLSIVVQPGGAALPEMPGSGSGVAPSASSTFMTRPSTIISRSNVTAAGDRTFTLDAIPGATFVVHSVSRLSGTVAVGLCGSGNFIYIPNPNSPSAVGSCVPDSKLRVDGRTADLVVVDFEVKNAGNAYVNSRFLQAFYSVDNSGNNDGKVAVVTPSLDAYGALPQSSRRTSVGFLVPAGQTQIQLVYGDYGKANTLGETVEGLLGKSVNGYIVNFGTKKIEEIPG